MTQTAAIALFGDTVLPWIVVWSVMSARFIGVALVFPLFSWLNLPMTLRFGFAAAMGLPLLPALMASDLPAIKALSASSIGLLGAKEVFLGVMIGTLAGLPFWMAQSGGEIVDTYRGSSAGGLFDPSLTTETSELGTAFMLAALAVLIWGGGMAILVAAVFGSYGLWPPLALVPELGPNAAAYMGQLLNSSLVTAIGIAGTLLVLLFAVDLALGLTSRSSRQFQVFELSLNIKNLTFAVMLPILILPILHLIGKETDAIRRVLATISELAR